jgi:hypothetical protein
MCHDMKPSVGSSQGLLSFAGPPSFESFRRNNASFDVSSIAPLRTRLAGTVLSQCSTPWRAQPSKSTGTVSDFATACTAEQAKSDQELEGRMGVYQTVFVTPGSSISASVSCDFENTTFEGGLTIIVGRGLSYSAVARTQLSG